MRAQSSIYLNSNTNILALLLSTCDVIPYPVSRHFSTALYIPDPAAFSTTQTIVPFPGFHARLIWLSNPQAQGTLKSILYHANHNTHLWKEPGDSYTTRGWVPGTSSRDRDRNPPGPSPFSAFSHLRSRPGKNQPPHTHSIRLWRSELQPGVEREADVSHLGENFLPLTFALWHR